MEYFGSIPSSLDPSVTISRQAARLRRKGLKEEGLGMEGGRDLGTKER